MAKGWLGLAVAAALTACSGGVRAERGPVVLAGGAGDPAPVGPGPIPPGPSAPPPGEAKNLDEPMAVVEGVVLTRRRMIRAVGEREETEEEAQYEMSLRRKVKQRAQELIIVKAAERQGLRIPPEMLDNAVRREAQKTSEELSKKTGRHVSFEEWLASQSLTMAEYREDLGNKIVIQTYFESMWKGMPGKRPTFDIEPSPADIRRLYNAHPDAFDVKASARISFWIARPVDYLEGGKRLYEQAVAQARARVEAALERIRAGRVPADVARELSIGEADFGAPPKSLTKADFEALQRLMGLPADSLAAWVFQPGRRARDTTVFEGLGGAIVGFSIVEQTPARRRAFEDPEVQDAIVNAIKTIRRQRAMNQHLLMLLSTASIHPPGLAEQIEATIREDLKKLDSDPFGRDVWLR